MKTTQRQIDLLTGNEAISAAVKQIRPDVIAVYPITPSTHIAEMLAQAVDAGELDSEFVKVESEHSAMATCIGAVAAGGRAFTATASQGLLYMAENIFWAGYGRLPMVAAVVNRALAPGWSIWVDHQDTMAMRDAGWGQFYVKNNQEAYDTVIQAYKIAEDHDVYFPFMVALDGFVLSHTASPVEFLTQEEVEEFVPPFNPLFRLHPSEPMSFGAISKPDEYIAMREDLMKSMERAKKVIQDVNAEFAKKFGRNWGGLIEVIGPEDAEIGIVTMSTLAEEAEVAAEQLTKEGMTTSVTRIRSFRPFPAEELAKQISKYEVAVVIDRAVSFGNAGQIYIEANSALRDYDVDTKLIGTVMGIGGQDISYGDIMERVKHLLAKKA